MKKQKKSKQSYPLGAGYGIIDMMGRISEKIAKNRSKMLDDFFHAYLSARWNESKNREQLIQRIKLVEKRSSDGLRIEWHFELKRGKLPRMKTIEEQMFDCNKMLDKSEVELKNRYVFFNGHYYHIDKNGDVSEIPESEVVTDDE